MPQFCLQRDPEPENLNSVPVFETAPKETENLTKWDKPLITYCLIRGTSDIEGDTVERMAVNLATETWEAEANIILKSVKQNQNPDIIIEWTPAKYDDLFSKSKGVMAWAGYPKTRYQGILKINDDLIWTYDGSPIDAKTYTAITGKPVADPRNKFKTYNLNQTLRHELGHILGLSHSDSCRDCIMFPFYNKSLELQPIDIKRITAKYGKRTWKTGMYQRFKDILYRNTRRTPN